MKKSPDTKLPSYITLIRVMVGIVFLSEGIQKFLFPETIGAARFAQIGFPDPAFFALFVGSFEIVCSILLLLGYLSKIACLPLLIIIGSAILSTKVPILFQKGFWPALHEGRTDFCMLMGLLFILLAGSGRWSLDSRIKSRRKKD